MNAPANISQPVEFSLPIKNYNEFYRFYLTEHRNINSRRLHAVGSSLGIVKLLYYSYRIRKKIEITHRLSCISFIMI